MDVGVVPRLLCGEGRRRQGEGGRGAARQPAAHEQARGRAGRTVQSSMLSFDHTLDAAAESAMYGTPDEIAKKLDTLQAAGVAQVLLNGPAGSLDQSAPLRARGDAGLCGHREGRGIALEGQFRSPSIRATLHPSRSREATHVGHVFTCVPAHRICAACLRATGGSSCCAALRRSSSACSPSSGPASRW